MEMQMELFTREPAHHHHQHHDSLPHETFLHSHDKKERMKEDQEVLLMISKLF